jgi:hypothetical protein
MAKMWINPEFKKVYEKKPSETKEKIQKYTKTDQKYTRGKPERKQIKVSPSEYYINKKIKERNVVVFKFIDNEICNGIIEWVDQRYMKIRKKDDEKGLVVEKRAIKYMK